MSAQKTLRREREGKDIEPAALQKVQSPMQVQKSPAGKGLFVNAGHDKRPHNLPP